MEIQKVIFSIDDNPHYKAFWNSISKHFKTKLNIVPKLFIIGDNVDVDYYKNEYGEIEVVRPIKDIPLIIQALWGKFYFTNTEPDTTWLIGDLDLYPMQRYHFKDKISSISDDSYVHLNPYAYGVNWREGISGLAGYFHVAKGKVFIEELQLNRSFEETVNTIFNSNKYGIKFYNVTPNTENTMASKDWGWFCCEEMYTGNLLKNSKVLVELPPDNSYNRINRTDMVYSKELAEKGYYIDFHAPRPYEKHSDTIEQILDLFI
jgi:hypothetical protein